MTPRAAVQQLGRMIRDDMRSGELSPGAHGVGDMLVEQPDAVLLIVDVTAAEARKIDGFWVTVMRRVSYIVDQRKHLT